MKPIPKHTLPSLLSSSLLLTATAAAGGFNKKIKVQALEINGLLSGFRPLLVLI
jgi:hypothetical protein